MLLIIKSGPVGGTGEQLVSCHAHHVPSALVARPKFAVKFEAAGQRTSARPVLRSMMEFN